MLIFATFSEQKDAQHLAVLNIEEVSGQRCQNCFIITVFLYQRLRISSKLQNWPWTRIYFIES